MKRLSVLIPDADAQLPLVASCLASSRRVVVHGMALQRGSLLKHSRFFASFEESQQKFDSEVWLQRIGEVVVQRRIDVVLPIAEFAIKILSEHRRALGWGAKLPPLPNPYSLDIATNKALLADLLDKSSIPHPPTVVATAGIPSRRAFSTLKFPVLAKPALSAGGVGIRRYEDPASLTAFLAERPGDGGWVVQTFIEGRDLAVNAICRDGQIIAATVQHAIKPSSQPYRSPIGLEFKDDPAAMKVAEALIRELGWSGVANIDMRLDALQKIPLVLEINGRYWFSLLGSLKAGVNFPLLACEMCLGTQAANKKPRSTRYFSGSKSVLTSLVGGGEFHIRPHETNLQHLDPLPIGIGLAQRAAEQLRTRFWRLAGKQTSVSS